MSLPATDNFNRANGALGANWTDSVGNDLTIVSNEVTASAAGDNSMYWSADAPDADQYAQIKIASLGTTYYIGPLVRASATDWVMLDATNESTDFYRIEWYNSNNWTVIGTRYDATPQVNDILKIEADGTTFTGYVNGTNRTSGSNGSAPSTGYGGIYIVSGGHTGDDFEVGNLGGGAAASLVPQILLKNIMPSLVR